MATIPSTPVEQCETVPATKRVRVTMTRTMWVDVPADEAENVLPVRDEDGKVLYAQDITDLSDHVTRWQRIAGYGHEHIEGDLSVEEADGEAPWYCEAVDATGRERYFWSARHFLVAARHQLTSARYREGNCPEVDDLNGRLAVLEDELRLMALEQDHPTLPEVVAWREKRGR